MWEKYTRDRLRGRINTPEASQIGKAQVYDKFNTFASTVGPRVIKASTYGAKEFREVPIRVNKVRVL